MCDVHTIMHSVGKVDRLYYCVFFRYYDSKRSAEKKEQKTIEAADKVRKLSFHFSICHDVIVRSAGSKIQICSSKERCFLMH